MKPPLVDVTFRALTAADIPAADALRSFAGWNQTPRDWQGYLEFEPAGCLVAEIAGRVVGTATTLTYGGTVGWIGMVLVHPDHRRGGIGAALLRRSIEYLRSSGIRSIKLDATPVGRAVYLPMGFQDEYELARFQGVAGPVSGMEAAGVGPLSTANWADVISFDAEIFGLPRPAVLASLAQRQPEWCFAAQRSGRVLGCLIARDGTNAVQLGPWIARDSDTAADLLAAAFARFAGRKVFIDVPASNVAGTELMHRIGFAVQRGYTRMYLGANPVPGKPAQIFSTSGAEKG